MQASLVCLTVTLIITLCYFLKTISYKIKPNIHFVMILISANVFLILGSIYAIKLGDLSVVNLKLINILKQMYSFVLLSLIALLWFTYEYIVKRYKRSLKEEWTFGVTCVFAGISTLILDCTVKFERLYYIIGPKIYPAYIVWCVFIFLSIIAEIRNFKNTSVYHKVTESLILLFNGFCVLLQTMYPESHFCLLGTVLIVVMLYVIVENPDIKRIEQEQEINKSKNQFVSMVSHEMRTPMNIICGMVEILQDTSLNDEQKKYLDNIEKSGQSLLCIINDILDYNKINEGKLEIIESPYDLYSLLADLETMLKVRVGSKPINLIFETEPGTPQYLIGDANRLKQILINFINNAIKFTDKGEVKVHIASKIQEKEVELFFAVSDTGQGIREKDINKLFKAFGRVNAEQNKNIEGTGLGLSINKKLIEMMGGSVSVSSIYGEGSTFSFNIYQQLSEAPTEVRKTSQTFICPTANIAVVDDNKMNLEVFKGLTKKYNANIKTFESGIDIINAIKVAKYDIIFVDRMMPGMSGEETIRKIRFLNHSVPVIALTADLSPESVSEMTAAGADDFMTKPINVDTLNSILFNYLDQNKISIQEQEAKITDETLQTVEKENIDIKVAIRNCGSKELFVELCETFYNSIDDEIAYLQTCLSERNIELYAIRVHALKSSCYLLGNLELGDECFDLEKAGKTNNIGYIDEYSEHLYKHLSDFKNILVKYIPQKEKKEMDIEIIESLLRDLKDTVLLGDIQTSDMILKELNQYPIDLTELNRSINGFDTEKAVYNIESLKKQITENSIIHF